MDLYLIPLRAALLLFPVLAAVLTIPYVLYQYHRYGSLPFLRVVIVYSFVFYLLCAYFMVILPLPSISEVANYTSSYVQLQPFLFVQDIVHATQNSSSLLHLLRHPMFFTIAFNLFLILPLGIYMRYYFQASFKKTILFCFCVSLSFELIQLSGLFGIYPRPYRLFDVDDLIINTIGGILGYALTPLLAHFLPTRKELDITSYQRGSEVSTPRRIMAILIDFFFLLLGWVFICFLFTKIQRVIDLYDIVSAWILSITFFVLFVPLCFHGKTLGKAIVKISLVQKEKKILVWYQSLLRYAVLYLSILSAPIFLCSYAFLVIDQEVQLTIYSGILFFIYLLYYFILMFQLVSSLIANTYPIYDHGWQIHNVSTIQIPNDEKNCGSLTSTENEKELSVNE